MHKLILLLVAVIGLVAPTVAEQPQSAPSPAFAEPVQAVPISHSIAPIYPPEAKRQRIEGTVVLRVRIGRNGHVEQAEVESGSELLQQAALDAVRMWVYRPYRVKGKSVAREVTARVIFTLDK